MAQLPSPRRVLSFGGGVNTIALMVLLIREREPLDEVVFADTGGETPETYSAVKSAEAFFAEHGIPFRTVGLRMKGGDLYATAERRRVIPSVKWRWCTRDFKVRPIHAYYKSLGVPVEQYIGIAYDEVHRMKDSRVEFVTNLYPLIDRKITRAGCIEIIEEAGLPVPAKSGCYFCPFNSMGRWSWLLDTNPDLFERAVQLEEGSKHFPRQRLTDQVYRNREAITLGDLRKRLRAGEQVVMLNEDEASCGGECMT